MLNVALTGNIAAGKSTVVDWFRRWGATVIDADALAREAQAPGTDVLATIVRRFGASVLAKDGSLDRAALRAKVMGDDEALSALNAIVHPAVQQRREELQEAARDRGDLIVINDIPLLFEVLDPAQFDAIVLVDAPLAVRRTRLRTLRGLTNEDADRMIAAQMAAERKRAQSHYVLDNDGTLGRLEAKALQVFIELRRRAARAAIQAPEDRRTLFLCSADSKDDPPALRAIAARYADAGVRVERAAGKPPALLKALRAAPAPGAVVATAAAGPAAREAWTAAGRPGPLLHLSDDPDPVAVRLDLRPWGHDRVALSEEGGAGLPPRADVW
ncbi:MAG TPA: dephospho-CoA kinase [Gemmatimonadales bacterium]|jgi:dephospho-CoA kinase|nr:dephospho-CoA kinase [Gemmatimonadales bacterium]